MNDKEKKKIKWGFENREKFLSDEHFRRYMMNEPVKSFNEELKELCEKEGVDYKKIMSSGQRYGKSLNMAKGVGIWITKR